MDVDSENACFYFLPFSGGQEGEVCRLLNSLTVGNDGCISDMARVNMLNGFGRSSETSRMSLFFKG